MGFKLPQLDTCCCGCTLRTGTLILLWLYVISNILMIALPPLAPQGSGSGNSTKVELAVNTTPSSINQTNWLDQINPLGVWGVIISAISIVIGGVGLYGVYKELHLHLLPYLIWSLVQVLITIIAELIRSFAVATFIGQIIGFLIFFYFWLVVFSHYRVLKGSVRPIQA